MNRPAGGITSGMRPGGATTLPVGNGNRPGGGLGNLDRPGQGAGGATTLPGQIGNRPGGGLGNLDRPGQGSGGATTLPGQIGNRPGGGLGNLDRPGQGSGGATTLPGQIGNRPGGGLGNLDRPGQGAGGATTLPGQIGNRPGNGGATTLPGQIPNRPGDWTGNGNRPGWGGNGNGGNANGNNRPPWNNNDRPGLGNGGLPGNRPWGNGNGSGNGNNIGNNININNNNNNTIVTRPGGGNWNGGNWGGGNWNGNGNWGGGNHWGGGGWYGGGGNVINNNYYGPGWSGAHYGNWYHGGSSNFWAGFGAGVVTSWGVNALLSPRYAYQSYAYYPSAWAAPVYGSWGLSPVASSWMYSSYANPYLQPTTQTVILQQPVVIDASGANSTPSTQDVVAYDYSKPIDTTAAPPEPSAAESAQRVFESARDRFKANDFSGALSLADQALLQRKTDPVLHEFRALCLFALKRYDEAAAVNYAVLSAGPSWDWATMINLYSGIDVYTSQLRELEEYIKQKPDSASATFELAYLYMAQGAKKAAARKFREVAALQPADKLSAQLAATLDPSSEQKATPQDTVAETPSPQPAPDPDGKLPEATPPSAPAPLPLRLVGNWTASPDPKVKIILALKENGEFAWAVTQDGRTQTITGSPGEAAYQDDVLVLSQKDGPPLTGKVVFDANGKEFSFTPAGTPDDASGLKFTLDPSAT